MMGSWFNNAILKLFWTIFSLASAPEQFPQITVFPHLSLNEP